MRPKRITAFAAGCLISACLFGQSTMPMPETTAQEVQPKERMAGGTKMVSGLLMDAACLTGEEKTLPLSGVKVPNPTRGSANSAALDATSGVATAGTTDRGLTGTNLASNPQAATSLAERNRVAAEREMRQTASRMGTATPADVSPNVASDGQGHDSPRLTVREVEKTGNRMTAKKTGCGATASTIRFAIQSNDRIYSLDDESNSKVLTETPDNRKFSAYLASNDPNNPKLIVTAKAKVMAGDTVHLYNIRRGR